MAGVYAARSDRTAQATGSGRSTCGIYEQLWGLHAGHARPATSVDAKVEGDAVLGARLVRVFADRWLEGAGRFAALCLPYLMDDATEAADRARWRVARHGRRRGRRLPRRRSRDRSGRRASCPVHPALDPVLGGDRPTDTTATAPATPPAEPADDDAPDGPSRASTASRSSTARSCAASGLELTDHEVAVRYYRERAARAADPVPEPEARPRPPSRCPRAWSRGTGPIRWPTSTGSRRRMRSPVVDPRRRPPCARTWGTSPGAEPERVPFDLDLYVDSSGSMPDPQRHGQLPDPGRRDRRAAPRCGPAPGCRRRCGAGRGSSRRRAGFVRDEAAGPAGAHRLLRRRRPPSRSTCCATPTPIGRPTPARARAGDLRRRRHHHVRPGRAGRDGRDVANHALAAAGGGGTMVLNLYGPSGGRRPFGAGDRRTGGTSTWSAGWADLVDVRPGLQPTAYGPRAVGAGA